MNHSRSLVCPMALSALMLSSQLPAAEQAHRQQEAHVHGEALLLIAVEGERLAIELHSPAMNIVGFEHQPTESVEHAAIEAAIITLQQPGLLFDLPTAARCELASVEIESPMAEDEAATEHDKQRTDKHEESHADEHEETHSEFAGYYQFHCTDMNQLKAIGLTIFKQLPAMETIEVQSISGSGQRRVDLTPNNPILEF